MDSNAMTSSTIVTDTEMPKVEIYTGMMCGYCARALRLLDSKEVVYKQIDVSMNSKLRAEMRERAGGRTSVPQIFIDDTHVGGCQELYELEQAGKLDNLLAT
jgi:glutaredoxin 3